ncbi:MAG: response regulator [Bacteroidales bacterium]
MAVNKLNFLIVDDIVINRMLLKEITSDFASSVIEANNGKEAISLLQDRDIDVILMDIEMPVMNGIETTRYIRSELEYPKNQTPIIAITAHNPDDFFEDYNNAGFDELLTKPYSFDKITRILKNINLK